MKITVERKDTGPFEIGYIKVGEALFDPEDGSIVIRVGARVTNGSVKVLTFSESQGSMEVDDYDESWCGWPCTVTGIEATAVVFV